MTIPTCPTGGDVAAGHSAEACLKRVTRQRNSAIRELERARWQVVLAERRERAWQEVAVLATRLKEVI
jgi:hypothetical protein